MNSSASFSFTPLMASEEMIFGNLFSNLAFLLPWLPIEFSGLDKKFIHLVEEDSRNISVNFLSKYL